MADSRSCSTASSERRADRLPGFGPGRRFRHPGGGDARGLTRLRLCRGSDHHIEFRWAEREDQLPALAADLVRMDVDVIFATSSTEVEPARQATKTIPIVFASHADPVGIGHVSSLPRPGGNITGLTMLLTDLVGKELEILKEVVPHAMRVGVLWNPTTPSHPPALQALAPPPTGSTFSSSRSPCGPSRTSMVRLQKWYKSASGAFSSWAHRSS